jgi:hypothetical protein
MRNVCTLPDRPVSGTLSIFVVRATEASAFAKSPQILAPGGAAET